MSWPTELWRAAVGQGSDDAEGGGMMMPSRQAGGAAPTNSGKYHDPGRSIERRASSSSRGSTWTPQLPYKEVVYNRREPLPTPLAHAPSLASSQQWQGGHEGGMIYVQCQLGSSSRPVEMLVDTGAQMSVMSLPLVDRLGLGSFMDWRQQGIAAGVGQARILGRLVGVPLRLGTTSGVEFAADFSVLDINQELLMLGIDQLRRFECIIDLQRQRLLFGGFGGTEVAFLPDVPRHVLHWRDLCQTM